uniref:Reverse transcriptase Ty1/copia-type domain-containing protein n=1 Tax=Peronospora matthiolae TaxID=2874970 RepID=A0AAV1TGY7_9STRA
MSLTLCSSRKLENAKAVQTAKNKLCNGHFLSVVEPGSKKRSAPDDFETHQAKRRSSARANLDEERKGSDEDNEDATPQVFWRASVNAVEGTDLSEPTTFKDAVDGPDQVHWRKAICADLDSMKLRGVLRAPKQPAGRHTIGTKWVFNIKLES